MSVLTIESVVVNLVTTSATAVTNMVFRMLLEVARERGLSSSRLANGRERIERGLFTWFSEQALILVRLEVSFPYGDKALEVFEFTFDYVDGGSEELHQPNVEKLRDFCRELDALPKGVEYAIKIRRQPWSSEVEGWVPCTFKEVDVDQEASLLDFGYGPLEGSLVYFGSTW